MFTWLAQHQEKSYLMQETEAWAQACYDNNESPRLRQDRRPVQGYIDGYNKETAETHLQLAEGWWKNNILKIVIIIRPKICKVIRILLWTSKYFLMFLPARRFERRCSAPPAWSWCDGTSRQKLFYNDDLSIYTRQLVLLPAPRVLVKLPPASPLVSVSAGVRVGKLDLDTTSIKWLPIKILYGVLSVLLIIYLQETILTLRIVLYSKFKGI